MEGGDCSKKPKVGPIYYDLSGLISMQLASPFILFQWVAIIVISFSFILRKFNFGHLQILLPLDGAYFVALGFSIYFISVRAAVIPDSQAILISRFYLAIFKFSCHLMGLISLHLASAFILFRCELQQLLFKWPRSILNEFSFFSYLFN